MENLNNNFAIMTTDELQNTDGGIGPLEVIGIVVGLYLGVREIVHTAGKAKGLKDARNGK